MGLTVPLDALIDSGREQHVFVERAPGLFEARQVQTGWRSDDRVQILRGLAEGERVVTAGTFLVDSESRLKAAPQPKPKRLGNGKTSPTPASKTGLGVKAGPVKDPACGMTIDAAKAVSDGNTVARDGVTYYFCSERCKHNFSQEPQRYLALNSPQRRP